MILAGGRFSVEKFVPKRSKTSDPLTGSRAPLRDANSRAFTHLHTASRSPTILAL